MSRARASSASWRVCRFGGLVAGAAAGVAGAGAAAGVAGAGASAAQETVGAGVDDLDAQSAVATQSESAMRDQYGS
jgi:hypothetical protein